jgi:hypothetical protein
MVVTPVPETEAPAPYSGEGFLFSAASVGGLVSSTAPNSIARLRCGLWRDRELAGVMARSRRDMLPSVRRVGLLGHATNPVFAKAMLDEVQRASDPTGIEIRPVVMVRGPALVVQGSLSIKAVTDWRSSTVCGRLRPRASNLFLRQAFWSPRPLHEILQKMRLKPINRYAVAITRCKLRRLWDPTAGCRSC